MKKPEIDYRNLSLSTITTPKYRHVLLLFGWIGYLILYYLTENLIPYEKCHEVHCTLDEIVPFCEFFIIFYAFWYLMVFIAETYYLFFDVENFKKLQTFIICTQVIAMAIYIIYPTCQNMRPDEFINDDILTKIMSVIYKYDTSTGVCPSLHVAYSIGVMSTVLRNKKAPDAFKVFIVIMTVLISLSTAFVKQHSFIDIFAALIMCIPIDMVIFREDYKKLFGIKNRRLRHAH